MHVEELHGGLFSRVLVHLAPGDGFVSEAGAMYRASANIDVDVTTRSRGGGLLGGLGRLLAGNTFFLATYGVTDGRPGEVGLAPTHMGEVRTLRVTPETPWMCAGGSFLGADRDVALEARFQGLSRGLLGGEGLAFLRASGTGDLVVSAFGMLSELEVDGELIVDTGHLVAFTDGLGYRIDRVGGGWIATWLTGEGFVLRFSGRGRVLLQSHDPVRFGRLLGPLLPVRET